MAAPNYTGSCKCNGIQIALQGEPNFYGLCHCLNCRKTTGSSHSTNAIFPKASLSIVKGTPKVYELVGGSGNPAFVHFCDNCGSTMWSTSAMHAEIVVMKVGILDGDAMEKLVPQMEVFAGRRPAWSKAVDGAAQCLEGPPAMQ